jgi:hypothetical protein
MSQLAVIFKQRRVSSGTNLQVVNFPKAMEKTTEREKEKKEKKQNQTADLSCDLRVHLMTAGRMREPRRARTLWARMSVDEATMNNR